MTPKVSIVIPVYNGSNYMKEAIDSALNQTYKNCEVIVVNDGSNDGGKTDSIAKSYGGRIRYFKKENGGVATAINLGIKNMTGEYFAWLSHDDVFYKDKIEKQINALLKSDDCRAVCHGNYDYLYMDGNRIVKVRNNELYTNYQLEDSNFAPLFTAIHGSTVLIHKSHFDRVGLYKEHLITTQDSEFLFRVMRGRKSVFLEDSLIIGRKHKEQGQNTISCHKKEYAKMFVDFCEELTKEEKENFCKTELNFYYKIYCLLKNDNISDEIFIYLREKINELIPFYKKDIFDIGKTILKIKEYSKKDKIYIYGAGKYGKDALFTFKSYCINNIMFLDSDIQKKGSFINGVLCDDIDSLGNIENKCFVVAMQDSREVIQKLSNMGAKNIIKYSDIRKELFLFLPEVFDLEN